MNKFYKIDEFYSKKWIGLVIWISYIEKSEWVWVLMKNKRECTGNMKGLMHIVNNILIYIWIEAIKCNQNYIFIAHFIISI